MVNRRVLRSKIFQSLYAYFQSESDNINKFENELKLSIDRLQDLYIYLLLFPLELVHIAEIKMEEAKNKRLPTAEDLNPKRHFVDNKILKIFQENSNFLKLAKDKHISWSNESELLYKAFNFLRNHPKFEAYKSIEEPSFEDDRNFIISFYKHIFSNYELLISHLQDKSIYWEYDDIDFILNTIIKNLKTIKKDSFYKVPELYKDEEDKKFVTELFRNTIKLNEENQKLIAKYAKNWEVDRIALTDRLLMSMAITEFLTLKSIPVKVSLNEYIELAKWYSTPKSKVFVNGILDKIVVELKEKNKIKKSGRGLVEN